MNVSGVENNVPVSSVNEVKEAKKIDAQPKVDLDDPVDSAEFSSKTAEKSGASTAKKIGVGVASFCIPGLGQFINGDVKKGAGFLLGNALLMGSAAVFGPVALIPAVALEIASVVDAVKGAK